MESSIWEKLQNITSDRRCANWIMKKTGCLGYSENPIQIKGNVGLDVGIEHGCVSPSELRHQQGTCLVTGATIQTGSECGAGQERFKTWLKTTFNPDEDMQ